MTSLLLDVNPGFYIGSLKIHYYALCIVTAMIMAAVFSALLMKRRNMSSDFIFTLFITCIPTAIVGARLFFCITKPVPIEDWYKIWEGGLSIIGGASSGVAMGLLVCKLKKVNFFRAADCVVPTIFLAHMFGRWGNFFNGEVYGGVVENPSMQWFPFAVPIAPGQSGIDAFNAPNATWHYAFFFYEGMICLATFCVLFAVLWKWKKKPNGIFSFSYFLIYGIMRTIMEPLRDSKDILSGNSGIPWSMVMSILYIVFGAVGIGILLFLNYRKEGSVFGSKKGDPCGITEYLSPNKNEKPYFSKINMFGANYPPKPEEEKVTVKEWFINLKDKIVNLFKKKDKTDGAEENAEDSPQAQAEEKSVDEQPAEEKPTEEKADDTEKQSQQKADSDE